MSDYAKDVEKKIKVVSNIPGLSDKIYSRVHSDIDEVYWYIRFNLPLSPETVSSSTMDVTDTDGYIMRTEISYDAESNLIVISPIDSYEQGRYYILNISKKVKSAAGQALKRQIYILFKLLNNKISEFQVLKKSVTVPKPRKRPRSYELNHTSKKVYSAGVEKKMKSKENQNKLPFAPLRINMLLGILGCFVAIGGGFASSLMIIIVSIAIIFVGFLHIGIQLSKKANRSAMQYNSGVRRFNREKYAAAHEKFKKATETDPMNEMAEYAMNKTGYYL